MKEFGLINRLNGLDHLPYWPTAPCNSITASEGKFLFASKKYTYSYIQLIKFALMIRVFVSMKC